MKIKRSSVLNSTSPQISATEGLPPTAQKPAPPARKSPASLSPTKQDAGNRSLEEQVFNVSGTTTTGRTESKVLSSPSPPDKPPEPENPEAVFHQRLTSVFSAAGKPLPTRKQSATAYAAIPDDWRRFLAWLPTAESFKTTRSAGGLMALIDFYDADKERPAAIPPGSARGEVPTWTAPGPTKCLLCADTGWEQVTKGDKTGSKHCSNGCKVPGQYEALGGIA